MASSRNSKSIEALSASIDRFLSLHIEQSQRLAVAYSGGLDSTVLLHCAKQFSEKRACELVSIHVSHQLSPNAQAWLLHCEKQAARWAIPHQTICINVAKNTGKGLEASARRARYAVLDQAQVDWIALGHHLDDQAETVILNLMRGTGIRGIAAMPSVKSRYLRPLLDQPRSELLKYALHHGFDWCEDESNSDPRYTRNYIRHEILPRLANRFPAAVAQLGGAASRCASAQDLLEDLARIDAANQPPHFPFPVKIVAKLAHNRACNLLRALLAWQGIQVPNQAKLDELVRQIRDAGPDRHPFLTFGDFGLRVSRGNIELVQPSSAIKQSP